MFSLSMAAANNILPMTHEFCECILKEAFIMQHCQFDQQHFDMEWTMHFYILQVSASSRKPFPPPSLNMLIKI